MHSLTSCLIHCVFCTKGRQAVLTPEIRTRLWPYLVGVAKENGMKVLAVGGTADHVHLLFSLTPTMALAKAIQLLKGNSSKWLHEMFPDSRNTSWQKGYGAFSIGQSGVKATVDYIRGQEEHHRTRTFSDEFAAFLRRHDLPYDAQMLD
jgi:putative transposase